MRVSEIRVKQIRVNQGLGVLCKFLTVMTVQVVEAVVAVSKA